MEEDLIILIAEDDDGHAKLIKKNIEAAGIKNKTIRFNDGEELLGFLFPVNGKNGNNGKPYMNQGTSYILLLDIRMPKVDGVQALEKIKSDQKLHKLPVIMLTTTDDPREVEKCHSLGCNNYITKPLDYEQFIEVIRRLGFFLKIVKVPNI
jgi:CheY-like chemotaxis protein